MLDFPVHRYIKARNNGIAAQVNPYTGINGIEYSYILRDYTFFLPIYNPTR